MKFFLLYDDLLTEGKYFSDEKFEWVSKNIGGWIFEDVVNNSARILGLPFFDVFKRWLEEFTQAKTKTNDDMAIATEEHIANFLNELDKKQSQNFFRIASERFPKVKQGILSYGKPERVPGEVRRGRKPGTKNKPKINLSDPSLKIIKRTKLAPEPVVEPEPMEIPSISEPNIEPSEKKMGRPKKYFDDLSTYERIKFEKEGAGGIKKLEGKKEVFSHQVEIMRQRIIQITNEIEKRKKYFGIE